MFLEEIEGSSEAILGKVWRDRRYVMIYEYCEDIFSSNFSNLPRLVRCASRFVRQNSIDFSLYRLERLDFANEFALWAVAVAVAARWLEIELGKDRFDSLSFPRFLHQVCL